MSAGMRALWACVGGVIAGLFFWVSTLATLESVLDTVLKVAGGAFAMAAVLVGSLAIGQAIAPDRQDFAERLGADPSRPRQGCTPSPEKPKPASRRRVA
ncbi:MAG: hypothetical protein KDA20_04235 [Phycisphaerales bacterium]|nr:hypothetical protein [Phycisphaerales bacterium]